MFCNVLFHLNQYKSPFSKNFFAEKPGFSKTGTLKAYRPKPLWYSESAWKITNNPLGFEQKAIEQLVIFPRKYAVMKKIADESNDITIKHRRSTFVRKPLHAEKRPLFKGSSIFPWL